MATLTIERFEGIKGNGQKVWIVSVNNFFHYFGSEAEADNWIKHCC